MLSKQLGYGVKEPDKGGSGGTDGSKGELVREYQRLWRGGEECRVQELLHRVSDITPRRRLRASTSSELVIPLSRLVTVGDRSFAVAGPRLWNTA